MKEIISSQGLSILVDDEDYPVLARHTWHTVHGKPPFTQMKMAYSERVRTIFLHKIMLASGAPVVHLDGNELNFQKENLQISDKQKISISQPKRSQPTSSKYKGVFFHSVQKKYKAQISKDRKLYRLGSFDDEIDAAKAYNKKAIELFGEDAWLNPV